MSEAAGRGDALASSRSTLLISLGISVVIGVLSAGLWPAAIALVVFFIGGAIVVKKPEALIVAALFLLLFSPQFIAGEDFRLAGLELSTLQNALILGLALLYLPFGGVDRKLNPLFFVYPLLVVSSYTLATWYPELQPLQPIKSLFALLLAPMLAQLAYRRGRGVAIATAITWMAVASVLIGLVLDFGGIYSIWKVEWTGVERLQGAAIPAHLSEMAWVGLVVGLIRARSERRHLVLATINLFILTMTGSRAPLVAAFMVIAAFVIAEVAPAFRSGRIKPLPLMAMGLLFMLALAAASPKVIERFESNPWEGGGAVNTSGRLSAWTFFWEVASEDLVFGRGIGAATISNTGQVHEAFRVPHNEYLRIIVDSGFVGLALVLPAFFWAFRRYQLRVPEPLKGISLSAMLGFAAMALLLNCLSSQQLAVPFWLILALLRDGSFTLPGNGELEP